MKQRAKGTGKKTVVINQYLAAIDYDNDLITIYATEDALDASGQGMRQGDVIELELSRFAVAINAVVSGFVKTN